MWVCVYYVCVFVSRRKGEMNKNGDTKKFLLKIINSGKYLGNFSSNVVIISEKHLKLCGERTWHAYLF